MVTAYIVVALVAYLLGSIPTGFLVGQSKGVDIRTVGSKNMGATNVFRTLGKGLGIFVLIVDALKGYVAVALVLNFYHELHDLLPGIFTTEGINNAAVRWNLAITAGIFAVLGHNYTCWLWFKGGKGIATTAGVYFALAPLSVSIALGVWIILFVATRYVSVGSIFAAVALAVAVWVTQSNLLLSAVTTVICAMAIYKHKANIQRLLAGTENRIQFKKENSAA